MDDVTTTAAAVAQPPLRNAILRELGDNWKTMLCIVVGMFVTMLPGYSFGVFIGPLSESFGWSVTAITGWSLIWSLGSILAAPFVGGLADRIGARRVVLISLVGLAVALAGLHAQVQSLGLFYFSAFVLGLFLAGSSSITYGRIITSLFDRGLGTALGLMSCGVGLAAIIGPRLMQAIIDGYGWRAAFTVCGVAMLLILPFMLRWLHGRDGPAHAEAEADIPGVTLGAAVRMPVFWAIAAGTILYGVAAGGVNINLIPFLTSDGMTRAAAAGAAGVYGIATFAGRFGTGIIIDRSGVHAAVLMAIVLAIQAVAFVLLPLIDGYARLLALLVYGFTVGAEADCLAYCVVRIFGRRFFGAIFGVVGITMLYIGTGIGPMLFASARDLIGSYTPVFFIWAGVAGLAVPLFALVSRAPMIQPREGH